MLLDRNDPSVLDNKVRSGVLLADVARLKVVPIVFLVKQLIIANFLVLIDLFDTLTAIELRGELAAIIAFVLVDSVHLLEELHQILVDCGDRDTLFL